MHSSNEVTGTPDGLEHAASVFADMRRRLFGIAYRILGSAAEAEDVVQETWLRWQATDRGAVLDPAAFLATTTTRLAITVAQSARMRRETYDGPWLPEPVDTRSDPELGASRGEALELGVLLLLERLKPVERAAYVLSEAFDYSAARIAEALQRTEVSVRQLVSRARRRIERERREPVSATEHRRLLDVFLKAAQTGDLASLEKVLTADAVSYSDSGGAVRGAARLPVFGSDHVARFTAGFVEKGFWTGASLRWLEANGRASVVLSRDGTDFAFVTISASPEGIDKVLWVLNPQKLAAISRRRSAPRAPAAPDRSTEGRWVY